MGREEPGVEIYKREAREFKPGSLGFLFEVEDKVSAKRMTDRVR